MIRSAGRAPRIMVGLALLAGAAWALVRLNPGSLFGSGELQRALTGRGRVAVFAGGTSLSLRPEGATLVPGDQLPEVARALAGEDVASLLAALEHARLDALLLQPNREANSRLG